MTVGAQESLNNKLALFASAPRPASVSDLRKLYADDPELLFELVGGVGVGASVAVRGLESVARRLAVLMRDGFQTATRAGRHIAEGSRGGFVVLDEPAADTQFLENLYLGSSQLKSLAGQPTSAANVDFYLKEFPWEAQVREMNLLRLDSRDVAVLRSRGTPAYQLYELLDCAREVVRSPRAMWRGLREAGDLQSGCAFCGNPSRSWRNDGSYTGPREGFVYVVFVDRDGKVFDWDWIRRDEADPSLPEDHANRFGTRVVDVPMADLVVDAYVPSEVFAPQPLYSAVGDCVFYYFANAETYARRIDHYLTAYFSFETNESVGFKLKFISRLIETVKQWSERKEEGIIVSFDPETVRVRLSFLMQAWLRSKLPLTEELKSAMELIDLLKQLRQVGEPEVDLPKELIEPSEPAFT